MADSKLIQTLTKGLTFHRRPDGSVLTLQPGRGAEIVVGRKGTVRINFRVKPTGAPKGLLSPGTKSWPGGGAQVTNENLATLRKLLTAAVADQPAAPKPRVSTQTKQAVKPKPASKRLTRRRRAEDADAGLPAGAHDAAEEVTR